MKAIADPHTDGGHQCDPDTTELVTPQSVPPKVRTPPRTFICDDSEEVSYQIILCS